MPARGSKSKKGYAANSVSSPQRDLVFFIDKCLGLKVVPEALRALGLKVALKTDHFPEDTPDRLWLAEVGSRRWVILSKDKSLRHNHIEIVELLRSGTHSFLLTSGNFTGPEMAAAFCNAMPDIQAIVDRKPPPLVSTVTKSGKVHVRYTYDGLIKKAIESEPSKTSRKDDPPASDA